MVGNTLRAFAFVFLSMGVLAGCGEEDEEDGGAADDSPDVSSCSSVATNGFCTEFETDSPLADDEMQACLDFGDSWSTETCPTGPDLIGCCHYWEFRDCYYTDYNGPDPAQYCSGDWTVGGR